MRHRLAVSLLSVLACTPDRPAVPASATPAWRLEPAATFTPPGDTTWIRPKAVVADREGNVYVLDEATSQIRVFDSAGRPLRTIGRKGAGPAEFAVAYGMGLAWVGDTLAVLDPGNGRLQRITREGKWVGSWPVKHLTGSGISLLQRSDSVFYAMDLRPAGRTTETVLVAYGRNGPGDTLAIPPRATESVTGIVCPIAGGGLRFFDVPFAWRVIFAPTPAGGMAVARTSTYRIAFLSARGDTLRTIEGRWEPVLVADSEWTSGIADYVEFRRKFPNANCDLSDAPRPRVKPVLLSLTFDDAGEFWVERRSPSGDVLDVYAPDARLLGTMSAVGHDVEIPPYVRGDRLYVVSDDEARGTQLLRSYRIIRP